MKQFGIITIIALSSFAAGKYLFPPKAEVKEVVKYVQVEKKEEKKNKVIVKKEVKKPDGTVITDTTETEYTQTNTDTSTKIDSQKIAKSASKITLGVLALKNVEKFSDKTEFAATVTVPLFGAVRAQAIGTTDKKVGLGLALDF